ncbi:MAG TPA: DUF6265 family protein [Burkholderiaceae bacterium]
MLKIALLLALAVPLAAQADELDKLAWLAGCWQQEKGDAGSIEQWMAPAGGTMLGMARTVRKGKTVEHEFLQIRAGTDGKLAYTAKPSGQAEASFALKEQGEQSVLFENPTHDFPQRISYRREGAALMARIEGLRNGTLRGIDFPMKKVACD